MIIIANERFSLNCLPTIIFLSLSFCKNGSFYFDGRPPRGIRLTRWMMVDLPVRNSGWNIGISWREEERLESFPIDGSREFLASSARRGPLSLPPPHCVATSRWRVRGERF